MPSHVHTIACMCITSTHTITCTHTIIITYTPSLSHMLLPSQTIHWWGALPASTSATARNTMKLQEHGPRDMPNDCSTHAQTKIQLLCMYVCCYNVVSMIKVYNKSVYISTKVPLKKLTVCTIPARAVVISAWCEIILLLIEDAVEPALKWSPHLSVYQMIPASYKVLRRPSHHSAKGHLLLGPKVDHF